MNLFGILNYVADQAKTSMTEFNPTSVKKTDEDHLLDPEFHMDALNTERGIFLRQPQNVEASHRSSMDLSMPSYVSNIIW